MTNKIYCGDTLETVKTLPDESIDSVITSPPYYQLRDYGWSGQWGLEKTYQEYLDKLISLMSELKRVLKPTGTMWINLGDSYSTISGNMKGGMTCKQINPNVKNSVIPAEEYTKGGLPSKSLMLIPHRFAIRCIDELGLILRNDVIWAKRNGMPESVTDRFSKKHEYIFFMTKQQKYYFDLDAVREKPLTNEGRPNGPERNRLLGYDSKFNELQGNVKMRNKAKENYGKGTSNFSEGFRPECNEKGKNPGDVSDFWDIPTQPSSEKHYASYNFKLIDKPIIAGCPEGGIILDPFAGTGTTILRAIQLGRKGIGIDGSKEYCEIANKRIDDFNKQITLEL